MLHALMQHLYWGAHSTHDAATNDSLRQFERIKSKQVHTLVKIKQPLGDIMQSEELSVATIQFVQAEPGTMQLVVKRLPQPRTNMQERKEARRIQPAAMPETSADHVVVVRRNGFQDVQQRDGKFQHLIGAAQQPCSVREIAFYNVVVGAFEFDGSSLHQEFRTLVHYLEFQLILVQQFFRKFL